MMLNVRRRDSHHRKMLAVLRTSAGAGKSKRVRADTAVLRTVDDGKIQSVAVSIKYFVL
jgi:ribosomal protein L28